MLISYDTTYPGLFGRGFPFQFPLASTKTSQFCPSLYNVDLTIAKINIKGIDIFGHVCYNGSISLVKDLELEAKG